MKRIVTRKELTGWAFDRAKELEDKGMMELMERDWEGDEHYIRELNHACTMRAATDKVQKYLNDICDLWEFDDRFEFDPDKIVIAESLFCLIDAEYESVNSDGHWETWHAFDLSGDDDVDYNSSYCSSLTWLLNEYHKTHPI